MRREVHRAAQRGRPRILFSVAPTSQDDMQEQWNHALAGVIAEDSDGGRAGAIRAGESWSAGFAGPLATRPDDGITLVVRLLADLEFGPWTRSRRCARRTALSLDAAPHPYHPTSADRAHLT